MTTQAFELQAVTDDELMAAVGGKGGGIFGKLAGKAVKGAIQGCLLYTSPSPRDKRQSRMPSSA